jgi:hypothetical protein
MQAGCVRRAAGLSGCIVALGIAALALILIAGSVAVSSASGPVTESADLLERLARDRFGDLTQAELVMVRTAPSRDLAWVSPVKDPDATVNDPSKAETWGPERTIRSSLIVWILTDSQASKLVHPSGLGVAGARIEGKLDLSFLTTTVPVTFVACSIAGGIDFSNARIQELDLRKCRTGPITGDQAIVNGDLTMVFGHYDDVSLFRTTIHGNLECTGSRFTGDDPLSVVDATIDGDALFHGGFVTAGLVDFRLTKIGRSLSFNDASFIGKTENGLDADRAWIAGTLYWDKIKLTPKTELDLANAHANAVWDDEASWPSPGNLSLAGFTYADFSGGPINAEARLKWLGLQPAAMQTQPQPYRELAKVLRQDGEPDGATTVEIARENAITRSGRLSPGTRIWRLMLCATIGYGYRPLRALWWILLFVLIGTMLFRWGYRERLIAPTEEGAYDAFMRTGAPPSHYPPFSSFVYSLENFLPVVELHQGEYWRPNPHHKCQQRGALALFRNEEVPAKLLRLYLWVHILAGWTITPLLFAGLAGLLHAD